MNFMAVSSSSLGLALHFNPKRGGTKAQQTVIWAMKLAENRPKNSSKKSKSGFWSRYEFSGARNRRFLFECARRSW
jgi:hypothetical protein